MAAGATRGDSSVVHGAGTEGTGALMTGLTRSRCLHVRTWLAFRRRAIMAACTATGDASVIHRCTSKTCCALMASLTRRSGLDMTA